MPKKIIEMHYPWKYSGAIPYSWMVNDLYRGIQAEQNYLVALGIFSYSEALGRMILGTIGNSRPGLGFVAFKEFTEKYVGYRFLDEAQWKKVFDISRNGLAHQYYLKSWEGKIYSDDGTAPCGIKISSSPIELRINSYFVKGIENVIDSNVITL
jgi:hypothetical protein